MSAQAVLFHIQLNPKKEQFIMMELFLFIIPIKRGMLEQKRQHLSLN